MRLILSKQIIALHFYLQIKTVYTVNELFVEKNCFRHKKAPAQDRSPTQALFESGDFPFFARDMV